MKNPEAGKSWDSLPLKSQKIAFRRRESYVSECRLLYF